MDYQAIREARLREPFRPFTLTTNQGDVISINEPTHLAISPNWVVVALRNGCGGAAQFTPAQISSLTYQDETTGAPS